MLLPAAAPASTYTLLHSFSGPDGANPVAALIRDSSGNLYGTTQLGGAFAQGTVFKLTAPAYTEAVLYSFTGGADGAQPYAGLILDSAGNLYGTTFGGGAFGAGTVFKLTAPAYTESVLYSFTGGADGSSPFAGLIRDSTGNLYGTTNKGGSSAAGVVFELSNPNLTYIETLLHTFSGETDGKNPVRGVIRDSLGNVYGATPSGGASGYGVIYKLIAPAFTEKILHAFTGGADGASPVPFPIRDSSGNLYGTAEYGGNGVGTSGHGVVFKLIPPAFTETVLYTFTGGADGSYPLGFLARDSAGNLYGTTYSGGSGHGVIFKLTAPPFTESVLHTFNGADGQLPFSGLIRDSLGNLYGTTELGGASGLGVVFMLKP